MAQSSIEVITMLDALYFVCCIVHLTDNIRGQIPTYRWFPDMYSRRSAAGSARTKVISHNGHMRKRVCLIWHVQWASCCKGLRLQSPLFLLFFFFLLFFSLSLLSVSTPVSNTLYYKVLQSTTPVPFLDGSISWRFYHSTILLLDDVITWRIYHLTILLLDDSITWPCYYLTFLLGDSAITWLLLDDSIIWLCCILCAAMLFVYRKFLNLNFLK